VGQLYDLRDQRLPVYSSLACTGLGALVGVGVLAACTLGLALTKGGF
jgi:hypothetical protein